MLLLPCQSSMPPCHVWETLCLFLLFVWTKSVSLLGPSCLVGCLRCLPLSVLYARTVFGYKEVGGKYPHVQPHLFQHPPQSSCTPTERRNSQSNTDVDSSEAMVSHFGTVLPNQPIQALICILGIAFKALFKQLSTCLLYTSPSPRDCIVSRMPSSA